MYKYAHFLCAHMAFTASSLGACTLHGMSCHTESKLLDLCDVSGTASHGLCVQVDVLMVLF